MALDQSLSTSSSLDIAGGFTLAPLRGAVSGRVINASAARAGESGFGFEGGRVLIVDGEYHLFTTELVSEPIWVRTEFAHWVSGDGLEWRRASTVLRSTGDFTGHDPLAALFSPMPVYNDREGHWDLFFVAYRCAPDRGTEFLRNHRGRILRARSVVPGAIGISGPWEYQAEVLRPGLDSQAWEGLQGTDSFFPYAVGDAWLAMYGSATTEWFSSKTTQKTRWAVGLAQSDELTGAWRRLPDGNPLAVEPSFIENPVVGRTEEGLLFSIYDNGHIDPALSRSFGLMTSHDGLAWVRQEPVFLPSEVAPWAATVRTPLGMIPDVNGRLRVYFTAFETAAGDATNFGGRGHVGVAVVDS